MCVCTRCLWSETHLVLLRHFPLRVSSVFIISFSCYFSVWSLLLLFPFLPHWIFNANCEYFSSLLVHCMIDSPTEHVVLRMCVWGHFPFVSSARRFKIIWFIIFGWQIRDEEESELNSNSEHWCEFDAMPRAFLHLFFFFLPFLFPYNRLLHKTIPGV